MEKTVTFTLDGDPQPYVLKFDFNLVCEAEILTGCNLMQALAGGGITAAQTRGLLYACLKTANPLLLLPEAGSLLSRDMPTVLSALGEILREAQGSETEETPEVEAAETAT